MNREYFAMLRELVDAPTASPRGMKTKELLGYRLKLDIPLFSIVTLPGFETNIDYAERELEWYLSGSNKIADLGEFAKCWDAFSDDKKHVNSAYGRRIFGLHPKLKINQWKWCLNKLQEDPDTRQAVINLNAEFDKYKKTKDFICTVFCQLIRRHNKLHWFTYMRSTDAYLGVRNDIFCFTALQRIAAQQLKLNVGNYYHFASSWHLYERHWAKATRLVNSHESLQEIKNVPYGALNISYLISKYYKNLGIKEVSKSK